MQWGDVFQNLDNGKTTHFKQVAAFKVKTNNRVHSAYQDHFKDWQFYSNKWHISTKGLILRQNSACRLSGTGLLSGMRDYQDGENSQAEFCPWGSLECLPPLAAPANLPAFILPTAASCYCDQLAPPQVAVVMSNRLQAVSPDEHGQLLLY